MMQHENLFFSDLCLLLVCLVLSFCSSSFSYSFPIGCALVNIKVVLCVQT